MSYITISNHNHCYERRTLVAFRGSVVHTSGLHLAGSLAQAHACLVLVDSSSGLIEDSLRGLLTIAEQVIACVVVSKNVDFSL